MWNRRRKLKRLEEELMLIRLFERLYENRPNPTETDQLAHIVRQTRSSSNMAMRLARMLFIVKLRSRITSRVFPSVFRIRAKTRQAHQRSFPPGLQHSLYRLAN